MPNPWTLTTGPNGETVLARGPERIYIWDDGAVEYMRFEGTQIVERYEIGRIKENEMEKSEVSDGR